MSSANDGNTLIKLDTNLHVNKDFIQQSLGSPEDLVITPLFFCKTPGYLIYITCLTDEQVLERIMNSIQHADGDLTCGDISQSFHVYASRISNCFFAAHTDEVIKSILEGWSVFLFDGHDTGVIIDNKAGEKRAIEEPTTEALIRGPRVGFREDISTNVALLRQQLADHNLRFKSFEIGRRAGKSVKIAYLEDVTNPYLIEEAEKRLNRIDIDVPLESGVLEQWMEDNPLSPFPQFLNTERPDKVIISLLEGRIAILTDGTPFALIAPINIGDAIYSPEDYYERWFISSLLRMLRVIAVFTSILLPSFYVALVSYHQGLIPSKLAFSIAASREGVPFPAFVEAAMMAITMELLREAGIRLPKPIGQTIGIVGGLVIGEAAVQAGVVSTIMVIIIAITAISSFALPAYSIAITYRILLFGFIAAGSFMGLYGIALGFIMLFIHISNLTSLGIPYTTPFAPLIFSDWKDIIIRSPVAGLTKRPKYLSTKDRQRAE
ncbi:spore germination protein [Bacillus fengqiuensis]|nr:spore germination protein [Bacillus fengqiuensis]